VTVIPHFAAVGTRNPEAGLKITSITRLSTHNRLQPPPTTYQEVDGEVEVLNQLVLGHLDVANGDGQTQDFLHLELDGCFDVLHLHDQHSAGDSPIIAGVYRGWRGPKFLEYLFILCFERATEV